MCPRTRTNASTHARTHARTHILISQAHTEAHEEKKTHTHISAGTHEAAHTRCALGAEKRKS